MCIKCDKIFNNKNLTVEDVKKIPYIQTDFIQDRYGKWYRCYCKECGHTEIYSL